MTSISIKPAIQWGRLINDLGVVGHLYHAFDWHETLCGIVAGDTVMRATKPAGPLCKRCTKFATTYHHKRKR